MSGKALFPPLATLPEGGRSLVEEKKLTLNLQLSVLEYKVSQELAVLNSKSGMVTREIKPEARQREVVILVIL